ncbi:MAG: HPF/RaiA family ribosome-associated protein [Saprospiraceae bacterium]
MDIKMERNGKEGNNEFENQMREKLAKFFTHYSFIESIKIFFRGKKHKYKKIKIQARLKGKDIFVEANGHNHEYALEQASQKLRVQVEKYKSKHYTRS